MGRNDRRRLPRPRIANKRKYAIGRDDITGEAVEHHLMVELIRDGEPTGLMVAPWNNDHDDDETEAFRRRSITPSDPRSVPNPRPFLGVAFVVSGLKPFGGDYRLKIGATVPRGTIRFGAA